MTNFTQSGRPMTLTTPLGPDAFLLEKVDGVEGISQLFHFRLEVLALEPVDFRKILAQRRSDGRRRPDPGHDERTG